MLESRAAGVTFRVAKKRASFFLIWTYERPMSGNVAEFISERDLSQTKAMRAAKRVRFVPTWGTSDVQIESRRSTNVAGPREEDPPLQETSREEDVCATEIVHEDESEESDRPMLSMLSPIALIIMVAISIVVGLIAARLASGRWPLPVNDRRCL